MLNELAKFELRKTLFCKISSIEWLFLPNLSMTKKQIHICLKMSYTRRSLLHTLSKAVIEADRDSEPMLAGIAPVRPDRQYILPDQAFYIWRHFSIV